LLLFCQIRQPLATKTLGQYQHKKETEESSRAVTRF
jgi:hypothetical protein